VSRRAARLAAVEILYASDVRQTSAQGLLADVSDPEPYCEHLVGQVRERQDEIDALLDRFSKGWTTERMSPVDRNVMRIATLELLEADVPQAAAIDEAVRAAKRFSGDEAGRYVNGVLEAVRQSLGGSTEVS
jgi:N utilization substance protein B